MKIIRNISQADLPPVVATIGFFDGVHRGHRYLLNQVIVEAEKRNVPSMVITFVEHPRAVMQKEYVPSLLTLPGEKEKALISTGIDYCVLLDFTMDMAKLSAQEFMQKILFKALNVRTLLIGYDHRFGRNRQDGFEDYQLYGQAMGIEVLQSTVFLEKEVRVSSSYVRHLLEEGKVKQATHYLSRPYHLTGRVIQGYQVGRRIGFPTANLKVEDKRKLIPKDGVYIVLVYTGEKYYKGMLSIGHRPTFQENEKTVEVHLLDVKLDLYHKELSLFFLHRLRSNIKFSHIDQLILQLKQDERDLRAFNFKPYCAEI